MGKETGISWTDSTFNIAWGCTKISPGCDHCYADTLSSVYGHKVWGKDASRRVFGVKHWNEPLKWNEAAKKAGVQSRVFCSSMCDIFEDHPVIKGELEKLWALIRATPNLDWQLLTKRSHRIADNLPDDWGNGYKNVWLGVSIENNEFAWRADHLRVIPAVVHFISYEPAIGPLSKINLQGIEWLIVGGESGSGARICEMDWIRSVIQRCRDFGVACFVKQIGAHPHQDFVAKLRDSKGGDPSEWPEDLRVREYPEVEP